MGFLVLLIIAAICGGIGQSLAGYNLGGCLVSIVVGFIGAYIGLWVAGKMELPVFFTVSIDGKPFPSYLGNNRCGNIYLYCCIIATACFRKIVVLSNIPN